MNIKVLFDQIIKVYSRVRIDVDTLKIKAQLATLQFHNHVFITTVISHPEADEILTHARFSYQYYTSFYHRIKTVK